MSDEVIYHPIGVIHTPYTDKDDAPSQGAFAPDVEGSVEIYPQYAEGLFKLDSFSHIVLIFHLHESKGYDLKAVSKYKEGVESGVFAIRSPHRPNPVGITVVKLLSIDGNRLRIAGVDMLDGTPLLDIKPFITELDARGNSK